MNQQADHRTRKAPVRLALLAAVMILAPVALHAIGQGSIGLRCLCAMAQSAAAGTSDADPPVPHESPLLRLHPLLFTAQQLGRGEVMINFRGRLYDSSRSVETSGISFFYDAGFSWGILDDLELTLQFQHVDSLFPGQQGSFNAVLTADNEGTMALRYTIWHNPARSWQFGSSASLSIGDRGVLFRRQGASITEENREVIPAFQLPVTAVLDGNWHVTVAPALALFPEEKALYLSRPPLPYADSFGPLFGFFAAVVYPLLPRVVLWGDIFVPVIGNNSINRDSGQPDAALAFNAGMRYLLNPRLAWDLYATNTLGSVGALAFLADRDNVGFGTSVAFLPNVFAANRRYADHFATAATADDAAPTVDGLAFFDGGTIPRSALRIHLQGGAQGILGSLHFSPVRALELAVYMDYIRGECPGRSGR